MRCLIVCALALTLLSAVVLGVACKQDERGDQTNSNQNKQQQQQTFPDPQSAATAALATFRTLVTAQNYQDFGFDSADELGSATLGAPLRVYLVRLDQLREYQTGSDPNRLLTDLNQLNYPVLTRQQVRSSVVVQQTGSGWRAATYGHGGLAQQIAAVRKAPAAGTAPDAAGQQFLVHVAALGLYFLGQRDGEVLMLTPVAAPPGSNLRAGTATRAEEVFAALVPLARAQREDAPM
jgi:hypothetical protein